METPQGGVAAFAVGSFGIRSEGEAAAEDRPHPRGVGGKDVHSRGRWSRHEEWVGCPFILFRRFKTNWFGCSLLSHYLNMEIYYTKLFSKS